ncbi:hypothetical protein QLQ12_34020 [Actinoplanes sp. NEAU-A12]|uniref:Uncharacterized protein n=1 Tax=Actinoplanes sandaracinus TaxID=3045177 RepID=A0ABT6WV68_9ACTN|nr:hypothetical protein [Actinoplanes sandaracinus]MDI6103642.1 hypothetical protein [Actinoplanes sandaracinus]
MRRRFAEYRPVPRWRARLVDVRLFRSVRLNLAGWATVTAWCLVGAVLGYAGGRLLHLSGKPGAVAGALTVLGCLVVLDRRRHARTRQQ